MFCDGCGGAVQPGQSFCSRCGKQIVGTIAVMPRRRGRVQEHVKLAGLLWLAISAFNTIGAVILYVVANTVIAHFIAQGGRPAFLRPLLSVIAILLFAKAAGGFAAGWGLVQHEKWARVLALVACRIHRRGETRGAIIRETVRSHQQAAGQHCDDFNNLAHD